MTLSRGLVIWFTAPMLLAGNSVFAKASLGIFGDWGAFSEPEQERCYAIAQALPDARQREWKPYLTVTTWPRRRINGQLHWQLARTPATKLRSRRASAAGLGVAELRRHAIHSRDGASQLQGLNPASAGV